MVLRKKPKGFLFEKNSNYAYAGVHLIADFWQAKNLNSKKVIEKALREAVIASGSDLLNLFIHKFDPNGFSAVAVISESHISLHTWPEIGYAAVDVFTCGNTKPHKALEVLMKYFKPKKSAITEIKRGMEIIERKH